jgi:hypothetical protein
MGNRDTARRLATGSLGAAFCHEFQCAGGPILNALDWNENFFSFSLPGRFMPQNPIPDGMEFVKYSHRRIVSVR